MTPDSDDDNIKRGLEDLDRWRQAADVAQQLEELDQQLEQLKGMPGADPAQIKQLEFNVLVQRNLAAINRLLATLCG